MFLRIAAAAAMGLWLQAAQAGTVYTGDRILGVPVIAELDVADLAPGETHRFMFEGVETGTGQRWYVPVMVAKGAAEGKRVLLVAGVHGDELNPIGAVQRVFAGLDPKKLKGAVVGIVGASPPGLEWVTRNWPVSQIGISSINPNRTWPGSETGNTVERHCWLIMNRLVKGNADAALDFHTGGTGLDFARFIFAYADSPEALKLAELFPVDQIMHDPGLPGTMEYALVQAGIPAITVELGGPRGYEESMVKLGVDGTLNVLAHYGIVDQPVGPVAKDMNVYVGNDLADVPSASGGYVEYLVKANDPVKTGQTLAIQRNAFGDTVQEYKAPVDGRVAIIGTDAVRERGATIASILFNNAACPGGKCPYKPSYD